MTQTPATPGDIKTGRGKYRMGEALARGDLAQIYQAETISGPRDTPRVVLKVALDVRDNDFLYNEVRILKLLHKERSPYQKHLPILVDQFKTGDNRRANILSHLNGHDLHSIREKYKDGIPERHIIWIFRRCLSVLGYAHSKGVVHGNIDPSHIIVRANDHNVWVLDWCYAVHNPARTGESFRILNETYSPPEVEQRKPPLPAADLYSLGKCMLYLLGGNVETDELPAGVDQRIQRFIQFFLIPSAPSRAQDAWEMYAKLDKLREEIYGNHEFIEFKM